MDGKTGMKKKRAHDGHDGKTDCIVDASQIILLIREKGKYHALWKKWVLQLRQTPGKERGY